MAAAAGDYEASVAFKFSFFDEDEAGEGAPAAAAPPPPPPPSLATEHHPTPPSHTAYDAVDVGLPFPLMKARPPGGGGEPCRAQRRGLSATPEPDVVPGVYEGGAKLWEGGLDLARLLVEHAGLGSHPDAPTRAAKAPPPPPLARARVLELGAGAALPGVVALLAGASSVVLADFNESVLPLAAANVSAAWAAAHAAAGATASPPPPPPVRYFAGDWGGLPAACTGSAGPFDVVLGAEVTYAPSACATLAAALASLLGPPPAAALIASKRYYFGVGGGVDAFTRAAEGAGLVVSLLATAVGPVPRDVLLVRRRE
jgi:hypothetical protein